MECGVIYIHHHLLFICGRHYREEKRMKKFQKHLHKNSLPNHHMHVAMPGTKTNSE